MRKNNILKLFYGLVVVGFYSCTHSPDLTNVRTVTFNNEVLPIFQTNCAYCHNATKQPGGYDLSNYTSIMKGIKAGKANSSNIYNVITSTISTMPPSPHKALNQDQRSLIYVWIEQGAKNN